MFLLSVRPSVSSLPQRRYARGTAQDGRLLALGKSVRARSLGSARAHRLAAINAYRGAVEAATATASMHGLAAGAGWWAVKDHDGGAASGR